MASDPLDDLLGLENEYYQEGYDAGVSDSRYAGLVEGKVFGIEKGFEKSVELGKVHGRALVWHMRIGQSKSPQASTTTDVAPIVSNPHRSTEASLFLDIVQSLPGLPTNTRLLKHVEGLLTAANPATIAKDNSDEAVSDFDDRIAKANAKTKVISNIVGETLNPASTGSTTGIEDATGLNARH